MKQTDLSRAQSVAIARGLVAATAARSYSWVEELDNDSGTNIVEGNVVVVLADGSIQLANTVNEPRPTGVAVDDIDTGESGQVCFGGPVDLVLTTGAVTAGDYGQSSTTAGKAQVASGPATAFCMFTDTGTDVPAFLWGGRGGGGSSSGGGGGPEPPHDHGNMGATETIDMGDGTWHRGTLTANCAITVTGFTVDEGLVCLFECEQDGTGGWDITWDADVTFIGDDQPDQTAGSVTLFLLISSAGDSTIYGAKVGGGASSPLTTKGDLWGYDTADARIPVGTNGYLLVADSTDAQGIVWENPETTGHWEVLMTGASPAEPLEDGSGTDWLYTWVS